MRVALGLYNRTAGGAELQACLLADGLRALGHTVTLYCVEGSVSDGMLAQWPPLPCRVLRTIPHLPGRLAHVARALQFRAWLHRDRIDAAVGFLSLPHGLLTLASLGTRVRLYGRRSCVWEECQGFGTYAAHVPQLQRWVRRWGWRTTALVTNAEAVTRSALECEGWPAAKLVEIANGWPEYPPSECASDVPYYVARPREEKALDVATQQFAAAGVPLALSYEPPDWRAVGMLAHCSRADALSNAVGLAMAHGIPVVAFRLPGAVELLGKRYVVPRWDYRAIVERVQHWRRNPRARRQDGTELWIRAREAFPLYRMVESWETLLAKGGA
jgi:hypothetical protein